MLQETVAAAAAAADACAAETLNQAERRAGLYWDVSFQQRQQQQLGDAETSFWLRCDAENHGGPPDGAPRQTEGAGEGPPPSEAPKGEIHGGPRGPPVLADLLGLEVL